MSPAHPSSAGKRGLFRVSATDPEPKSAQAIREDLGVPSLDGDNRFTGANVFEGTTEVAGLNVVDATLSVNGQLEDNSDDPAQLNAGIEIPAGRTATIDGQNILTDAPRDGKYYVRKDGAWVEIVP